MICTKIIVNLIDFLMISSTPKHNCHLGENRIANWCWTNTRVIADDLKAHSQAYFLSGNCIWFQMGRDKLRLALLEGLYITEKNFSPESTADFTHIHEENMSCLCLICMISPLQRNAPPCHSHLRTNTPVFTFVCVHRSVLKNYCALKEGLNLKPKRDEILGMSKFICLCQIVKWFPIHLWQCFKHHPQNMPLSSVSVLVWMRECECV